MSVYCGYCGQRGHNKLSCPQRMKDAAENPDSYVALRVKREREERARRVANRSCTYCSGKGHNRRGCKVLKADKAAVLDKLRAYRDKFAKAMSDSGFGVGALIELPDGGWREMWSKSTLYMVTEIAWQNVDFRPLAFNLESRTAYNVLNKNIVRVRPISSKGYDVSLNEDPYRGQPPKDDRWISLSDVANLLPENLFSPEVLQYIASQNKPRPENPAFEEQHHGPTSRMISPTVGVKYSQPDEFYSVIPEDLRVEFCFESRYGSKDRWSLERHRKEHWLWNGVERVEDEQD